MKQKTTKRKASVGSKKKGKGTPKARATKRTPKKATGAIAGAR